MQSSSTRIETFYGNIEDTMDALLVLQAIHEGILPRVRRRLIEKERKSIRSGSIFVFDQDTGIKRWTDGRLWSPSRIQGNFLIYREIDKKVPPKEKKAHRIQKDIANGEWIIDSIKGAYYIKKDGLLKKTITVVLENIHHHLVAYIHPKEAHLLSRPSKIPLFADIQVCQELLCSKNFRRPLTPTEDADVEHQEEDTLSVCHSLTETTCTSPHLDSEYLELEGCDEAFVSDAPLGEGLDAQDQKDGDEPYNDISTPQFAVDGPYCTNRGQQISLGVPSQEILQGLNRNPITCHCRMPSCHFSCASNMSYQRHLPEATGTDSFPQQGGSKDVILSLSDGGSQKLVYNFSNSFSTGTFDNPPQDSQAQYRHIFPDPQSSLDTVINLEGLHSSRFRCEVMDESISPTSVTSWLSTSSESSMPHIDSIDSDPSPWRGSLSCSTLDSPADRNFPPGTPIEYRYSVHTSQEHFDRSLNLDENTSGGLNSEEAVQRSDSRLLSLESFSGSCLSKRRRLDANMSAYSSLSALSKISLQQSSFNQPILTESDSLPHGLSESSSEYGLEDYAQILQTLGDPLKWHSIPTYEQSRLPDPHQYYCSQVVYPQWPAGDFSLTGDAVNLRSLAEDCHFQETGSSTWPPGGPSLFQTRHSPSVVFPLQSRKSYGSTANHLNGIMGKTEKVPEDIVSSYDHRISSHHQQQIPSRSDHLDYRSNQPFKEYNMRNAYIIDRVDQQAC